MLKLVLFVGFIAFSQAKSLQDEIAELKSLVLRQGRQLELQQRQISKLTAAPSNDDRVSMATVAFMTTITEFSTNYTDDDTVGFNNVIQDTAGGAFNPETGTYRAPVDGLYLFYIKVGAFINGQSPADEDPIGTPYNAEININLDGVDIANSNCFDGWDYIRNCQLTYPLQLVEGQEVKVRIRSTQRGDEGYLTVRGIQENNGKTISYFGGHLVL